MIAVDHSLYQTLVFQKMLGHLFFCVGQDVKLSYREL
jgi:hypothetical protein